MRHRLLIATVIAASIGCIAAGSAVATDGPLTTSPVLASASARYDTAKAVVDETKLLLRGSDVGITNTHLGNFTVGAQAEYLLTVTNYGPERARLVELEDDLPDGVELLKIESSANFTCPLLVGVRCGAFELAPGESGWIKLTVLVGSQAYPTVTSYALAKPFNYSDPYWLNNFAADVATVSNGDLQQYNGPPPPIDPGAVTGLGIAAPTPQGLRSS